MGVAEKESKQPDYNWIKKRLMLTCVKMLNIGANNPSIPTFMFEVTCLMPESQH